MLQSEKAILAKGLYRAYNGTIAVDGTPGNNKPANAISEINMDVYLLPQQNGIIR